MSGDKEVQGHLSPPQPGMCVWRASSLSPPCMPVSRSDHKSCMGIDLGAINTFSRIGAVSNKEPVNDEDGLRVCFPALRTEKAWSQWSPAAVSTPRAQLLALKDCSPRREPEKRPILGLGQGGKRIQEPGT